MTCPACSQVLSLNSAQLAATGQVHTTCPSCGADYLVSLVMMKPPKVPKSLLAKVANRPR